MQTCRFSMWSLGVVLVAAQPGVLFGGSCRLDVPVRWTIQSTDVDGTTPTRVTGDGLPYVDGQSGVSATIKVCTGTNDAVLQLNSSARSLTVDFSKPLATNSKTPSWANGPVSGQGILNVRNLTYLPAGLSRADEYDFTTRAGGQLPVKGTWNFRTWRAVTDAASDSGTAVTAANTPYTDSLVLVHHCPAHSTATAGVCVGIVRETWFVHVDPAVSGTSSQSGLPLAQVSGLQDTHASTPVNAGQFSISFSYVIETLN